MKTIAYYRVSSVTPENGRMTIETPFFERAREVHDHLMRRQLDPNDMTHDVSVTTIWR